MQAFFKNFYRFSFISKQLSIGCLHLALISLAWLSFAQPLMEVEQQVLIQSLLVEEEVPQALSLDGEDQESDDFLHFTGLLPLFARQLTTPITSFRQLAAHYLFEITPPPPERGNC